MERLLSSIVAAIRTAATGPRGARKRFAERAGVPESTLRDIATPNWNPRLTTLSDCAKALEPGACGAGDPHPGLPPHAGASGATGPHPGLPPQAGARDPHPGLPPLKAGEGEGEEVSDAA